MFPATTINDVRGRDAAPPKNRSSRFDAEVCGRHQAESCVVFDEGSADTVEQKYVVVTRKQSFGTSTHNNTLLSRTSWPVATKRGNGEVKGVSCTTVSTGLAGISVLCACTAGMP